MIDVPRKMRRGDTLFIKLQIFRDLNSGELSAIDQGDPYPIGPKGGPMVPQDLTGFQRVLFTMKNFYADPDNRAIAQLDELALGGITITIATAGLLTIAVPPSTTGAFVDTVTTCIYDVRTKDATGNVQTVDAGTVEIDPGGARSI
jgi:hypothetical protein